MFLKRIEKKKKTNEQIKEFMYQSTYKSKRNNDYIHDDTMMILCVYIVVIKIQSCMYV